MPGLLLRALVPVGFMPLFGPGLSVGLMLCPAYAPVPIGLGTAGPHSGNDQPPDESMDMSSMDMSMDMPMGATHGESSHAPTPSPAGGSMPSGDYQQHSLCPYAKSATLAGPFALFSLPVAEHSSTTLVLLVPQITWFQISPRAQSPRAPPALA
jgi:hypothetical protein